MAGDGELYFDALWVGPVVNLEFYFGFAAATVEVLAGFADGFTAAAEELGFEESLLSVLQLGDHFYGRAVLTGDVDCFGFDGATGGGAAKLLGDELFAGPKYQQE